MAEIIKYLDETQGKYLVQKILAEIPTALSELTNDQNFIDNTVDNLANYYLKSEVDTKIGDLATIEISIVDALPETGKSNVIYLVPKEEGAEAGNLKDEYLWNATDSVFEKIGDTAINLSGYLTTEVAAQVYATKAELATEQGRIATLENKVEALEEGTYDDTEVRGLITAENERATAEEERLAGLISSQGEEIDGLGTDLATVDGKVTTLIGEDANKSVRTIANEELASQLIAEDAKESLDTLAEIAAWIQSHPDDAAAMNAAIVALQNQLIGIDAGEGTVKKYVDDAIAALAIGDYAKAADLTALADRVSALETEIADKIELGDISVETTGDGNVVTAVAYDEATGKVTVTKDLTIQALTETEIDAWFE